VATDSQESRRTKWRRVWIKRRLMMLLLSYFLVVLVLGVVNLVLGGRPWALGIAAVWGAVLLLRVLIMAVISRVWLQRAGFRKSHAGRLGARLP
jgi:cation transporter-like permease